MGQERLEHSALIFAPIAGPSYLSHMRIGAEELEMPDAQRANRRPLAEHHWRHRKKFAAIEQDKGVKLVEHRRPRPSKMLPPNQVPQRPREGQARRRFFI